MEWGRECWLPGSGNWEPAGRSAVLFRRGLEALKGPSELCSPPASEVRALGVTRKYPESDHS